MEHSSDRRGPSADLDPTVIVTGKSPGGRRQLPTDSQRRFIERALRRKKLFLAMSIAGIVIAVVLAAYYGFRRLDDPTFPIGSHAVIVVLILLNSRQNLRQYRFASFVEEYRKTEG